MSALHWAMAREAFAATLAFIAMLVALDLCAGCASAPPPKPTEAQAAAEGAYGADLLACVERAKTLAESRACRAEVDKRWGVVRKDAAP